MTESKQRTAIPKLVAFDMDGTLLAGRVIYALADRFGFVSQLKDISQSGAPGYVRSRNIAKLLKGLPSKAELTEVVRGIRLTSGAVETMKTLRDSSCKVGIISDSYSLATEIVAAELKMDFHVANSLVVEGGVITGALDAPMGWERIGCPCKQSVCKRFHLYTVAKGYGVPMPYTAAVGDSESDSCMIESAGVGIWFNAALDERPQGGFSVKGDNLRLVLAQLGQ